jgi:uncharacterized protein (TIGR02246 family)
MHTLLNCSFCLLSALPLFAQNSAEHTDDAAIRNVVSEYLTAREHSNPEELAGLFTDDADQLVSSGEWRRGKSALVNGTLASSASTGGTRSITLDSVRFLTPGVAIADGRYELAGLAGGTSRKMWTTFVLLKGAGRWRIAAIRNMLPAAPVPSSGKPK